MTNTVYFHNTIRDDFSTTTEETSSTSDSYTHQPGLNPVDDTNLDWTPSGEGGKWEYSNSKVFSFNELKTATRNFHKDDVLVEGGFGRVFMGWIVGLMKTSYLLPSLGKVFLSLSRVRDDESVVSTTTEEEETPQTSNRYTHQQGLNPVDDNNVDWTPSGDGGKWEYSNSKVFSFNELKTATRNFNKDDVLVEGGFGRVFKGWIDENKLTATKPGEGIPVTIKRLGKGLLCQGHHEWQPELNYSGRFYHPNLLRLLGYCLHNEERLLVFEFMPRGSLDNHLFRKVSTPLSWSVRMKIALGAAKGLAFLHSAPINVIHRNCKSSNILLDTDYNAKLADFRLAIDGPTGDETHVDTGILGTIGYAAPEYLATGHLTAKCDVYTFGVVLLEMLCGRRVINMARPSEEHNLVDWAMPYLNDKHKVYCVADRQLEGQYSLEGFQKAANLTLICLSMEGMSRPNMDEVVKVLGEL